MVESVTFQIGNIIADASIAIFALVTFLHEKQRDRIHRILSLLLSLSTITEGQATVIDALVNIGDQDSLEKYIYEKTKVERANLEKFETVQRNLRILHYCNIVLFVTFAIGIAIETVSVLCVLSHSA